MNKRREDAWSGQSAQRASGWGIPLATPAAAAAETPLKEDRREYPLCPRVGVGGIVIHAGRVLLVERGQPPLAGRWSIPGGLVELGETLTAAVRRELREETGLSVEPIEVAGVFERVEREKSGAGPHGQVRYHYVIVDYRCRLRPARGAAQFPVDLPRARSDASNARWVARDELEGYHLSREAKAVILKAFERSVE